MIEIDLFLALLFFLLLVLQTSNMQIRKTNEHHISIAQFNSDWFMVNQFLLNLNYFQ